MNNLNNSKLIGFVMLGLLSVITFYLIKNYKTFTKNDPKFCKENSASWQTPEQCALQQGHYIAGDQVCKSEKLLGNKSNDAEICCVNCTDEI